MKSRTFDIVAPFVLAAALLAGCSRAPATDRDAPKFLRDPAAGVSVSLPDTAAGSVSVTPADRYVWSVGYAPNRTLLYFRVLDIPAQFLPIGLRNDVIARILRSEQRGMLGTFSGEATAPDGSPVELFAGFDRENNGVAGFAWQGGKTTLAVFALTGPGVEADGASAGAVLAELWPRLSLSPRDWGVETRVKSHVRYNPAFREDTAGRDNEIIDAAYAVFSMRAHDPDNYRGAIDRLCAILMLMDRRGDADPDVRLRAVSALDSFSDILHRDQLAARGQFLYAVGRRDRDAAAAAARLLDALDSPFNPDAKPCSQARWERVRGI